MGIVQTTRAAEGLARRAFSVTEVERMQDLGIFRPDEKYELLEGEIVPMQAKSPIHELIKNSLVRELIKALPDQLWLGVESTLYLTDDTALDPDLLICPAGLKAARLSGADIILAIEVSHASLAYDRGPKARLYARHGVRDYWVIDAKRRRAFIHREPSAAGRWGAVVTLGPDEPLTHAAVPGFSLRLADI
jgi:Uma2 family endonuclease